jgi:hypothetical protein
MVNMDKFVLVINSTDYFQRFTSVNDQVYIMNNTNIPAGNYRCRWSFRGGLEASAAFTINPTLYLRSSTVQQAYSIGAQGGNQISYCLGTMNQTINTSSTTSYFRAGPNDNVCFYWNYNPGSEIRITIRSGTTQTLYSGTSEYILMIEMERLVDEDD